MVAQKPAVSATGLASPAADVDAEGRHADVLAAAAGYGPRVASAVVDVGEAVASA